MPYVERDDNGNITGYTRWPNQQTSEKIDETSEEWLTYINATDTTEEINTNREAAIEELLAAGTGAAAAKYRKSKN